MASVFSECACPQGPHQCVGCERILSGPGVVCVACLEVEAAQLADRDGAEMWPGEHNAMAEARVVQLGIARRMANA